jgi:serine protease Do
MLLRVRANEEYAIVSDEAKPLRVRATQVPLPDAIVQARERLGMTIEQLSPLRAERYGLDVEEGLLITEVARNGVAGRAGLRPGDVLIQLGRYRVATFDDFSALLSRFPETGRARAYVIRDGQVGYAVLEW